MGAACSNIESAPEKQTLNAAGVTVSSTGILAKSSQHDQCWAKSSSSSTVVGKEAHLMDCLKAETAGLSRTPSMQRELSRNVSVASGHKPGTVKVLTLQIEANPANANQAANADQDTSTTATLSVVNLDGERLATIKVDLLHDTLRSLREDINARIGVEPECQSLIFGTKRSSGYGDGTKLGVFLFDSSSSSAPSSTDTASESNFSSPTKSSKSPESYTRWVSSWSSPGGPGPGPLTPAAVTEKDASTSRMSLWKDDACMPLELDELNFETQTGIMQTWNVSPDGSWHHNKTGLHISPEKSIRMGGVEYGLPPQDIEFSRANSIGSGSGGVVHMGRHKPSGMQVAVKTLRVSDKLKREQMLKEIRSLILAVGSPNLIQWYAGFVGRDSSLVHVVVEFMDLGSLADLRERLCGKGVPPDHLLCVASQILHGLSHLQARKLLHRDVKPENILHNRAGHVKLTDFGIAKELSASGSVAEGVGTTFVGTATYMAPERMGGEDYTFQSDIWSAGMVIYELATGRYPFEHTSFLSLAECVCDGPPPRLDADRFPQSLCDIVAKCLTLEGSMRPDAVALLKEESMSSQGEKQIKDLALWFYTFSVKQLSSW